jgi:hypothetical protein
LEQVAAGGKNSRDNVGRLDAWCGLLLSHPDSLTDRQKRVNYLVLYKVHNSVVIWLA